jgi:hypothetical protein
MLTSSKCSLSFKFSDKQFVCIVTLQLKGGIVEPEETEFDRQRLDKHVSAATGRHATIEELLETMFSMQSTLSPSRGR